MILEITEDVQDIIGVLLAAFAAMRMIPLLKERKRQLTVAFFMFAMLSLMFTYAYCLAFYWMKPDVRIPLSANTVGEYAIFLLLSATLESVFRSRWSWQSASVQIVLTLLFTAASIALWIVWSGEWIQDIIGGIVYGYHLCICVCSLKETDAFSKKEWILMGIDCAVTIALWIICIFVPESLTGFFDVLAYAAMYLLTLFFLVKTFFVVRKNTEPDKQLALSISSYAWCISAMYMSSGYYYAVSFLLCLFIIPLMFLSVQRVVRKEAEAV